MYNYRTQFKVFALNQLNVSHDFPVFQIVLILNTRTRVSYFILSGYKR